MRVKDVLAATVASIPVVVWAGITLDNEFPWQLEPGIPREMPLAEAVQRDIRADGYVQLARHETLHFARVKGLANDYFLAPIRYQSREQTEKNRSLGRDSGGAGSALPGGGVCAIFAYSGLPTRVGRLAVSLKEGGGRTYCNGIQAVSAAKVREGVLLTVSYYVTDGSVAKRASEIGQDWRYMTVLIRLREEGGQLVMEQDDRCFGNPNALASIADARKALKECGLPA